MLSCELEVAHKLKIIFRDDDRNVSDAAQALIGLSNSSHPGDGAANLDRITKIRKLLSIPML